MFLSIFFILLFITTAFNFILIYCMQRCPSKVWSLVFIILFFCCTDVQKMFNSVNEYNLSEKQLSGCQSMIAWFSDVNESDTKKIMCRTYV